jgi:hypothetical protein
MRGFSNCMQLAKACCKTVAFPSSSASALTLLMESGPYVVGGEEVEDRFAVESKDRIPAS